MYRLGTLLLLCLLAHFATAQIRFSCNIDNLAQDFILVEKPYRGKYFPQAPEKILAGKKGRFLIETTDNQPGFCNLHLGEGRVIRIFLEPGRTSSLSVNMDNFERSLKFSGPQAAQNKFLNGLDRSEVLPVTHEFTARGGLEEEVRPKDAFLSVTDYIEAEQKVLKKKGKKNFSAAFIRAMQQDIVYYHTCRFSQKVAKEFERHQNGEYSQFNEKWANYWAKTYELPDFSDPSAGVTEYYLRTLDDYLGAYRLGYLEENEYLDPDLTIGEQFLEYDRLLWKDLAGEALEYAIAGVLSYRARMGKNEPILFDLFQKYRNDLPNSPYLKLFEKAVQPISDFMSEESVKLPHGMVNLSDQDINTVEELLDLFPGKVVFMDVWATWCSPCLFEFRQKRGLEEFAEGKEIVLLFISVDDTDREERWRKIITDHDLKGYHLMASYSLRDELINTFGDGSNLALPHYMIYDKSGNLANGNAEQPSRNHLLYRQLERYLD